MPCVVCKYTKRQDAQIQRIEGDSTFLGLLIMNLTALCAGRTSCPTGFDRLYYGRLFADHISHQRTEHICLDINAQGIGSTGSENGALIVRVEMTIK